MIKQSFSELLQRGPVKFYLMSSLKHLLISLKLLRQDFGDVYSNAFLVVMGSAGSPFLLTSEDICPPDSELIDGICKCNEDLCPQPSCDKFLTIVRNGTDNPGHCCPLYTCDNCTVEGNVNGTCACGEDAFLNDKDVCECIDPHKTFVDDVCVCDTDKCELPLLCDNHSVPVKLGKKGCCVETVCRQCPEDSFPKNFHSDEIEDKCICYPCPKMQCDEAHVPQILQRGRNIPTQCCDLYQCIPKDTPRQQCLVNDLVYEDEQWWITEDKQNCTCNNGVALCNEPFTTDILVKYCLHNDTSYPHGASWTEDTCTNCTCNHGVAKCIAHLCNVTESIVRKYEECSYEDHLYQHSQTWITKNCLKCVCYNGVPNCEPHSCNTTSEDTGKDCPSLENCKRSCKNGYKVNRRGCEVCKCKIVASFVEKDSALSTYMKDHNLSENDILVLLNHKNEKEKEAISEQSTEKVNAPGPNKERAFTWSVYIVGLVGFIIGALSYYGYTVCKKKCTYNYSPVSKPMDNNNLPQGDIKYISEKSPLKT
ncbi:hypothetical protein Trydic_g16074 [Trypoxylus dichotomus]